MGRFVPLLLTGLVAVGAGATPGWGVAPRLVRIADVADGFVVTDGSRTYGFKPSPSELRITDTVANTRRSYPVPEACRPAAQHAGEILLSCGPPAGPASGMILRVETGAAEPVRGVGRLSELDAIGSRWIQGAICDKTCASVYVSRRTGENRLVLGTRPRDLDSADLRLKAPPVPSTAQRPGRPLAATWHGKRKVLSPCPKGCERIQRGPGFWSWTEFPRTVRAWSPVTGRSARWLLPRRSAAASGFFDAFHTRNRLIVIQALDSSGRLALSTAASP